MRSCGSSQDGYGRIARPGDRLALLATLLGLSAALG